MLNAFAVNTKAGKKAAQRPVRELSAQELTQVGGGYYGFMSDTGYNDYDYYGSDIYDSYTNFFDDNLSWAEQEMPVIEITAERLNEWYGVENFFQGGTPDYQPELYGNGMSAGSEAEVTQMAAGLAKVITYVKVLESLGDLAKTISDLQKENPKYDVKVEARTVYRGGEWEFEAHVTLTLKGGG